MCTKALANALYWLSCTVIDTGNYKVVTSNSKKLEIVEWHLEIQVDVLPPKKRSCTV